MATATIKKNDIIVLLKKVSHGAIAGNAFGNVQIGNIPAPTGYSMVAMFPTTLDEALQLTIYYSNGWRIAYYNAYTGQASAGDFDVRIVFAKNVVEQEIT